MHCLRWCHEDGSAPEEQLLLAVRRSDYATIQQLLTAGTNPNAVQTCPTQDVPWTAVHEACSKDNDRILRLLIQYGANIDLKVQWGITPLVVACCHTNSMGQAGTSVVHLLLQNGCNVNEEDDYKESVLPIAICRGDLELTQTLLLAGCRLNTYSWADRWRIQGKRERDMARQLSQDGPYTMLTLALHYAWVDIATLVLVHGFNPNKYQLTDLLRALKGSLGQVCSADGCDTFLTTLYGLGYRHRLASDLDSVVSKYKLDETCANILQNLLGMLPSLAQLCRVCVRQSLRRQSHGCSIWQSAASLPIPQPLVDYITMKEVVVMITNNCPKEGMRQYMGGTDFFNASRTKVRKLHRRHPYIEFWRASCCCFKSSFR